MQLLADSFINLNSINLANTNEVVNLTFYFRFLLKEKLNYPLNILKWGIEGQNGFLEINII